MGDVSLREITGANRAEVERLAVEPDQERYVAGVADSLLDAAATPAACPMLGDGIPDGHPEYLGPYCLWRLPIDARRQRQGFGSAALDLAVESTTYLGGHNRDGFTAVAPGHR